MSGKLRNEVCVLLQKETLNTNFLSVNKKLLSMMKRLHQRVRNMMRPELDGLICAILYLGISAMMTVIDRFQEIDVQISKFCGQ